MADFRLDWATASSDGTTSLSHDGNTVSVEVSTPESHGHQFDNGTVGGDSALTSAGVSEPTVASMSFDQPITNVSFELFDVDSSDANWDDKVTVIALDQDGNKVPITFSNLDHHNVDGNTVEGDGNASPGVEGSGAPDSVTVSIDQPIVSLEIIHDNGDSASHTGMIGISDITFDAAPPALDGYVDGTAGDDVIDASYTDDPDGDMVDHNDAVLPGATGDDDYIRAGDGNDTVRAGAGDDIVEGGAGHDSLEGGDGNDVLSGGGGDDGLYGGAGDDTLSGGAGRDKMKGGDGNDRLDGGTGNDSLEGGNGADALSGGDGDDNLYGGTGDDTLSGGAGDDKMKGSDGDDRLDGGAGNDRLEGGNGDDTIIGGAGSDNMSGGEDRDTFIGANVGDHINGGEGGNDYDTLDLSGSVPTGGSLNVIYDAHNHENGTVQFFDASGTHLGNATFEHIENVVMPASSSDGYVDGTSGDDVIDTSYTGDPDGDMVDHNDAVLPGATGDDDYIRAGGGNDTVQAGAGNDIVEGGAGDDTLSGGAGSNDLHGGTGDDTFVGGDGADRFWGNAGQDNLDYSGSSAGVHIDLSTNSLSGGDADNDTIIQGIDGAIGSEHDDVMAGFDGQGSSPGDAYTNEFYGMGGNDTIDGRGGDDILDGGEGDDTLIGGSGDDQMTGGEGDDQMTGGAGADTMSGGDDRDTFQDITVGDHVDGGEGGDDLDTLDLTGSAPTGGSLHVTYDSNPENGTVEYFDASGASIGTMEFENIEHVVPCFTPGTLITTAQGERPVEDLQVGDKVITRDNGLQEIRWVGARRLTGRELAALPRLKPVLIRKGALGDGNPQRDMLVSPNHRLLLANEHTSLYFGEDEVLVAAKHLVNDHGIRKVDVLGATYLHFMFDRHEVVLSNGLWTESFQPGDYTFDGMDGAQRSEILALFPELATPAGRADYRAARMPLKKCEASVLFGEHLKNLGIPA